jgi:hypothetical protein
MASTWTSSTLLIFCVPHACDLSQLLTFDALKGLGLATTRPNNTGLNDGDDDDDDDGDEDYVM